MSTNLFLDLNDFEKIGFPIGTGGFGTVFKVKNTKTGEILAAKEFKEFRLGDETEIQSISRELNIIAKLSHPSVLKFFGYSPKDFDNNPKPVLITEYAENNSLYAVLDLENRGISPTGWDDTKKLITIYGIASGMSYLHDHDIIHRDLKPHNILMDSLFFPKIGDFGFSKKLHDSFSFESTNCVKGTPSYIAPEIWAADKNEDIPYSKASDVYAFGMLLYEMMSLKAPFEKLKIPQICNKVTSGERPELINSIEDPYKNLIERCWSQDPKERPTFVQIIDELQSDKFITPTIDKIEFSEYIDYINDYLIEFNEKKRINLTINYHRSCQIRYKNKKIAKKQLQKQIMITIIFNIFISGVLLFLFTRKSEIKSIFPNDIYDTLDQKCQKLVDEAKTDPNKQFLVGKFLIEGKQNFPKKLWIGLKYLEKSISSRCIDSVIYYCRMHIEGTDVPIDISVAKNILAKYLKSNDPRILFLYGKIIKKQNKCSEAFRYFVKSAKGGDIGAMYKIGKMLFIGKCCKKNTQEALRYLQISHQNGNSKSSIFIKTFDEMKQKFDYFNNLESETQYVLMKNIIKNGMQNNFSLSFDQVQLLLSYNSFDSENFLYFFKSFSEVFIEVKYPSQSFEKIMKIIRLINREKIAIVRTNLLISGPKVLNYRFGNDINNGIHNAIIESSVEKIEEYTFYKCHELVNVSILSPLLLIEEHAFEECFSLTQISLPLSLKKFGVTSFFKCNSLTKVSASNTIVNLFFDIGHKLLLGEKIEQNDEEACRYFKIAADKGQIDAICLYGFMLFEGQGVEKNYEEACRYFKMAADKGRVDAMYLYGHMLFEGQGVEINYEGACRYFKMAADRGQIDAMYEYGHMFKEGLGVEKNYEEACRYFKMAADKGQIDAIYGYGFMLNEGLGVEKNYEEACRYYKMAADKGHLSGIYGYGLMLIKGLGVEINYEGACRYFKMAADKGHIDAMYLYGHMLKEGLGVEKNNEEACRYFKMAADRGQIDAMIIYGIMMIEGRGVEKNYEEACRYYKMAADKGQIEAIYGYGLMLASGLGVEINEREACRYFKMAADRDYKDATDYFKSKGCYQYGFDINQNK